jgi:hypothetical protein
LNTKFSKISKDYLYIVKTHFLGSIWRENIFESLGSDLNSKWNSNKFVSKENRKEKGEKNKENRKGPRGTKLAQPPKRPAAQQASPPNRYPLSLPLSGMWVPPTSATSSSSSGRNHCARKRAIPPLQSH